MPRLPPFEEPVSFLRFFGRRLDFPTLSAEEQEKLQFLRLTQREAPMKLEMPFSDIASGETDGPQTFTDLEADAGHVIQAFFGVSRGVRARIFHTNEERILKWDQLSLDDVNESDTANIEFEDSPITDPRFELWIAGGTENFTPAITVENIMNDVVPARNIDARVLVLAAVYTFEFVDPEKEPQLTRKLEKGEIDVKHAFFGGQI